MSKKADTEDVMNIAIMDVKDIFEKVMTNGDFLLQASRTRRSWNSVRKLFRRYEKVMEINKGQHE